MRNIRFEKELEFVQLLCNPDYIRWLFDEGYFENKSFLDLLQHLNYWKKNEYKVFLTYPACLNILDILNKDNVLEILKDDTFYTKLAEQQYYLWKERGDKSILDDLM
ncbi:Mediator of RNA polymerase II transcription subunit 31 [Nosema granulosis]|uniref:Mediator of RNA polymerase II transcription subunit 31 n=1 Tax=Nosema granulosis TaxID=83296 RepID=A0A9P6H0U6_9MICR|nr:Mediator of RNA polymerase II transcription subunit 31 [Nosema granulosis]